MQPDAAKRVRKVEQASYDKPGVSAVLLKQVRQHNESSRDQGLRYLRGLLTSIGGSPEWGRYTKPLLHVLNGVKPEECVKLSRDLLEQQYASPDECFIVRQVALLVKKYPFQASRDVAQANALKKFLKGERKNRHINRVIRNRTGHDVKRVHPQLGTVAHKMRDYMYRLLGDKPDWKEISLLAGWGPGANVLVGGRFTNYARKFLAEKWTCTREALPYFLTCAKRRPEFWDLLGLTRKYYDSEGSYLSEVICVDAEEFDRRVLERIKIVDYNKIAFVPKDADCDRTIASEPLCNSWLQKGVDEYMRLRLRRFGIDLRDQSRNQQWACEGSLGGFNPRVTLDLSNASGSICTELVRDLFHGTNWFKALDDLRSKNYRLPEQRLSHKYHGFVSMGNGFCFPLETAIFASICYAAHEITGSPQDFTSYGDDIVCRQSEALLIVEILRSVGFAVNTDKSFFFGPFRESCGTDWYDGVDVRPVVLDTSLDTFEERIRFHNALARLPNVHAAHLASACVWFWPPFAAKFVRPFADHTDESIDGRHMHWVGPWEMHERKFSSPAWYGLSFAPCKDEEIENHVDYPVALYYGALSGVTSETPFAERRETRMRVARFSHSGNTSNWLPLPPRLMAVVRKKDAYASCAPTFLANLVVRRMAS